MRKGIVLGAVVVAWMLASPGKAQAQFIPQSAADNSFNYAATQATTNYDMLQDHDNWCSDLSSYLYLEQAYWVAFDSSILALIGFEFYPFVDALFEEYENDVLYMVISTCGSNWGYQVYSLWGFQ